MNRRPVDLSGVTKAVNEAWREFEMSHKPAFIIDLQLPTGSFDVNVTPDKREAFIPNVRARLGCVICSRAHCGIVACCSWVGCFWRSRHA